MPSMGSRFDQHKDLLAVWHLRIFNEFGVASPGGTNPGLWPLAWNATLKKLNVTVDVAVGTTCFVQMGTVYPGHKNCNKPLF